MTDTLPHPYPTKITDDQLAALTAGLNPHRVSKRDGMSYVEAWDIKATLIRVFGFGGFSSEVLESEMMFREQVPQARNPQKMNWKVSMRARVRLTIHQTGATYTEDAIAGSSQPDITESMDMALKSAESDALKRAAIFLGTQFGLSLYDNGSTNDVVRVVLAPDQVWPLERRQQIEAREAARQLNAIVEGQVPVHANGPVIQQGTSLTPEKQAETQALIERGLRMKAEREQDPEQFARAAAEAAAAPGVPGALDPSLEPGFEDQHADAAQ
jgi:recombination DNA repair RAD52 pathway protein